MVDKPFRGNPSSIPGTPPQPVSLIFNGGAMGELIRSYKWSETSVGPIEQWSPSLLATVNIILNSNHPMWIGAGSDLVFMYNDAYVSVLGLAKHPVALGKPASQVWAEIWDVCGPLADKVLEKGESTFVDDVRLYMRRENYSEEVYFEEVYFSFSYSPIVNIKGNVEGLFCPSTPTTEKMLSERRLKTLGALSKGLLEKTIESACDAVMSILEQNPADIPFALLYLINHESQQARLVKSIGIQEGVSSLTPSTIDLASKAPVSFWVIEKAIKERTLVEQSVREISSLPLGLNSQPISEAVVVPLVSQNNIFGVLIAGVNPARKLDTDYRTFYDLLASQVALTIQNARNYEEEKRRAEVLTELDKAKTVFFSNISHELRTPLTLILGELEEVLSHTEVLSISRQESLQRAQRNATRLLKLVNSLLDFSRFEAKRVKAYYSPLILEEITSNLVGMFRFNIEKAGLTLTFRADDLKEMVYVDSDMWEKVVFNLLSNALKYTLKGKIEVCLFRNDNKAVLEVKDTGVGIPESELPRLFRRFERVENIQGRSHEGTGIGLALVKEIINLHGGTISVQSQKDEGSLFSVEIPFGHAHLPSEQVVFREGTPSSTNTVKAYLQEADRWLPTTTPASPSLPIRTASEGDFQPIPAHSYILIVDDNADMRSYIEKLLNKYWAIRSVSNGKEALDAIKQSKPDLVLSDAMMPEMDGFGLLKELKDKENTRDIPILLISARAGEEAKVEGLQKGADDYLTKPFSVKELLARINKHLESSNSRKELVREIEDKENQLRTQEETSEALLKNLAVGILKIDTEYKVTYFNNKILEITGLSEDKFNYTTLINALHPDDKEKLVPKFEELINSEEHWADWDIGEYRYVLPNGTFVWVAGKVIPKRDKEGKVIGVIITITDITLTKKIEIERLQAIEAEKAYESGRAKMAEETRRAQEKFIDTLCHELRNPLNSIMGCHRLLSDLLSPPNTESSSPVATNTSSNKDSSSVPIDVFSSEVQEILYTLMSASKHMGIILNDVLDMSKIQSGKLKLTETVFSPLDVIKDASKMFYPDAKNKNIEINIIAPVENEMVMSDENRLKQVLINLIANSIRFTENGTISIVLKFIEKTHENLTFEIHVKDSGMGINQEQMQLLFERFSQISSNHFYNKGGSGLGLWISKELVGLMGGSIGVDSKLNEGSDFYFTIRAKRAKECVAENQDKPLKSMDPVTVFNGKIKVLLVEDNIINQRVMKKLLESRRYMVCIANDGIEAVESFKENPDLDVILMDIEMPRMDGVEATKVIRNIEREENRGKIPIIGVSGNARPEHEQSARDAGMTGYLTKPVSTQDLYLTVEQQVNSRKQSPEHIASGDGSLPLKPANLHLGPT